MICYVFDTANSILSFFYNHFLANPWGALTAVGTIAIAYLAIWGIPLRKPKLKIRFESRVQYEFETVGELRELGGWVACLIESGSLGRVSARDRREAFDLFVELVRVEKAREIYSRFAGERVRFPSLGEQERAERNRRIYEARKKGMTFRQITENFGVTDRHARDIVNRFKKRRTTQGQNLQGKEV